MIIKQRPEIKASIISPSLMHTYSLGMEYIRTWFFNRVNEDAFKSIHIVDRDALDAFRHYNAIKDLKKDVPSLAIESRLDMDFYNQEDRLPDGGMDAFVSRTRRKACFFNDPAHKIQIAMTSQTVRINYTFKIRLKSKAMQLEWVHYLKQALRVGETQSTDCDIDFHVPRAIILQVAREAGFEVVDEEVVDIHNFISYLNQYSFFPFTYKIRSINQHMEYFARVMDITMHISCLENMTIDDGERINMTSDNFTIEIPVNLTFSTPKLFVYYSEDDHDEIFKSDEYDNKYVYIALHDIVIPDIPDINKNGWKVFIKADWDIFDSKDEIDYKLRNEGLRRGSSEYEIRMKQELELYEEDRHHTDEYAYLDLNELIKDSDVEFVHKKVKPTYINPKAYLEFKVYSVGRPIELEMNWNTLIGRIKRPKYASRVGVVCYLNKEFVNTRLLQMTNGKDDRMNKHKRD